ncbi:MAG: DMT family transporter [Paracoccaceae bacterium]
MSPQKSIPSRAWMEMFLLALIWGGSFLSFSLALREIGVFTTVAFRVGGGAIVLWIYILARGLKLPKSPKIWAALLVQGMINNVIPFSLIAWGQLRVPSGLASILNASTAIIGIVIAAAFFADERLTPRKLTGVVLGFLGVATAIGLSAMTEFNLTSLAQLAIVGSSLAYALSGVWARKTLSDLSPQVAAAGMVTAAALFIVPFALWVEGVPTFSYAPSTWAALIHLSVIATALAYLLYYRVLGMAGSGNLMLVTLLVAPVAILLGAVVLGEELKPQAYAGFALLAIGLLVLDGRILRRRK